MPFFLSFGVPSRAGGILWGCLGLVSLYLWDNGTAIGQAARWQNETAHAEDFALSIDSDSDPKANQGAECVNLCTNRWSDVLETVMFHLSSLEGRAVVICSMVGEALPRALCWLTLINIKTWLTVSGFGMLSAWLDRRHGTFAENGPTWHNPT